METNCAFSGMLLPDLGFTLLYYSYSFLFLVLGGWCGTFEIDQYLSGVLHAERYNVASSLSVVSFSPTLYATLHLS